MDYYDILGIDKNASISDIKKAYKKQALKWHPDKNNDPNASEMFQQISKAYQVLINQDYRDNYDNYGESPDDLIKPDEIFKQFFSQFDPKVSEFLCDTYDVFSTGLKNYDKQPDSNTKLGFWDFLSTLDTERIIEKGSDLLKTKIIDKINKVTNKKFVESISTLNHTYELKLDINDLDDSDNGMNDIPVDYDFLRKYAFIKLIVNDELMLTHKFIFDLSYDNHEISINNRNFEFNINYKFIPQLKRLYTNDLFLNIPIHYSHIIKPFYLNYPLSKNLDIKLNFDLGGISNLVKIDTYGLLNNSDYTLGNMYILFEFSDEITEFEKPKYNVYTIKPVPLYDLLTKN